MSASTPQTPPAAPDAATAAPPAGREGAVDWVAIASTPEFQELHASRRRYTLGGTAIGAGALLLLMGLLGFAPDAMGKAAIGSVTWALLAGAAAVVLTFVMALAYARKAADWEEMSERVVAGAERGPKPDGRFAR
jgi:uncharacterized membrane protein (DUF485 family)